MYLIDFRLAYEENKDIDIDEWIKENEGVKWDKLISRIVRMQLHACKSLPK